MFSHPSEWTMQQSTTGLKQHFIFALAPFPSLSSRNSPKNRQFPEVTPPIGRVTFVTFVAESN